LFTDLRKFSRGFSQNIVERAIIIVAITITIVTFTIENENRKKVSKALSVFPKEKDGMMEYRETCA